MNTDGLPLWLWKACADMEALAEAQKRFFAAQKFADEMCKLSKPHSL